MMGIIDASEVTQLTRYVNIITMIDTIQMQ